MGERTMDPPMAAVILHFLGGQRLPVPASAGDAKVPLSGQASISLSMAFEPSATISELRLGGKCQFRRQFAATDNNDNAPPAGSYPASLRSTSLILEAVRLPMVACQVSYEYSNGYVVALFSSLSDSTVCLALWVKASVSKSYGEGYSPNCLGQSCSSVTFHMKSLTNPLGAGQNWTDT